VDGDSAMVERDKLTMVATLGFGIDFIVRRLADLRSTHVTEIIVVGLYTDHSTWQRIEQSYNILSAYLKSQNITSRLERIEVDKHLVRQAREIINKAIQDHPETPLELYLTGGPRILLAAFYTAALTFPEEYVGKIRITVYGEGFPASLTVEIGKLLVLARLDEKTREILERIKEGYNSVGSLLAAVGLPRSTLYKKLEELEKLGLIVRSGRGKYDVHPALEQIL